MRIAIVVSQLSPGGAERQLSRLANALVAQDAVDFILLNGPDEPVYFDLDPRIGLHHLDARRPTTRLTDALRNGFWRVGLLTKALRQREPDVAIAVLPEAMIHTALAARRLGIPFIASQRNNPVEDRREARWRLLQDLSFRAANAIVFQTERAKQAAPGRFAAKGTVIPNIVSRPQGHRADHDSRVVVAAGRLDPVKGFDLLLRAFATVHESFPEWTLRIFGDGAERPRLEQLSRDLGLAATGTATLPGVSDHPLAWMDGAGIFVLPSRTEGFPNVLCEAMAAGFPCVAADCNFGPSELVRPGSNGLLVPKEDPAALASAISSLIESRSTREQLGAQAREIVHLYGADKVAGQWRDLMVRLTIAARRSRKADRMA